VRPISTEAARSSCLYHSLLASDINQVNHPIRLSKMTERGRGACRGAVTPQSNRAEWRSEPGLQFHGYRASS
jgi:hypothetical protein